MAMKKCKECGNTVSTRAQVCPYCGVPKPTKRRRSSLLSLAMFFLVAGVVYWFVHNAEYTSRSGNTVAVPRSSESQVISGQPATMQAVPIQSVSEKYVAKKNCFAATSQSKLEQFTRIVLIDKDPTAMARMVGDGDIVEIPEGEIVFRAGGGFLDGIQGIREIRRTGETQTYWVDAAFLAEQHQ